MTLLQEIRATREQIAKLQNELAELEACLEQENEGDAENEEADT